MLCGPLKLCNSTKAETMGLFMGIRELKRMGAVGALIEGDLSIVIGWGQGKSCNLWELWSCAYEITEIALDIGCSFSHIPREQNSMTDSLANWGVAQSLMYSGYCIPF